MVDFSALLKRPAGQAKKPPVLPIGDYPGKITGWEPGESARKKTPFVRYHCKATGWPDSVDESEREFDGKPIDLSKKSLHIDYYITPDAEYRHDEFLRSIGVELEGRSYEESIPDAVGTDVLIVITQRLAQDGSDNTFNDVADLKPLG